MPSLDEYQHPCTEFSDDDMRNVVADFTLIMDEEFMSDQAYDVMETIIEQIKEANDGLRHRCWCGNVAVTEIRDPRCPADVAAELDNVPMILVCPDHAWVV